VFIDSEALDCIRLGGFVELTTVSDHLQPFSLEEEGSPNVPKENWLSWLRQQRIKPNHFLNFQN